MASKGRKVLKGVAVTATIDTAAAFATGDAMHTNALEFDNILQQNGSGVVRGVTVSDLDKLTTDLDVVIFTSDPTSSTITANAAFDADDTDLLACAGHVSIVDTDYTAFNDNAVANKECYVPVDKNTIDDSGSDARDLWVVLVSRDTDNFSTATALTVTLYVEQD